MVTHGKEGNKSNAGNMWESCGTYNIRLNIWRTLNYNSKLNVYFDCCIFYSNFNHLRVWHMHEHVDVFGGVIAPVHQYYQFQIRFYSHRWLFWRKNVDVTWWKIFAKFDQIFSLAFITKKMYDTLQQVQCCNHYAEAFRFWYCLFLEVRYAV